MTASLRIVLLVFTGAFVGLSQPVVSPGGVVNSGNYLPACVANGGVAPGSIFVIFGRGLGPSELRQVSSFPLSNTLEGTSIRVTVAGTTVDALPIYTSATQVAAVLPSGTPVGSGTVAVSYGGGTSAPAPIRVIRNAFGIFTLNQSGSGQSVVEIAEAASRAINGPSAVARAGQTMVLWGTGLGAIQGDEAAGPLPNQPIDAPVTVWVGNQQAKVIYAGRSGCCAGLDQIVFEAPHGVEGCYTPLAVEVGGVYSNFGSIAIGSCADASPTQTVRPLTNTGGILIAGIDFQAPGLPSFRGEFFSASFRNAGDTGTARVQSLTELFLGGPAPPPGSCALLPPANRNPALLFIPPVSAPSSLDAGTAITVSGSGGDRNVPSVAKGEYELAVDQTTLPAGRYQITNASGGADIGAFDLPIDLSRPTWGPTPEVIPRSQDLTITWTADPSDQGLVAVTGSANACGDQFVTFVCYERASAGALTVPSRILQQLPSAAVGQSFVPGSLGVASLSPNAQRSFTAPNLDIGFLLFLNVRYRLTYYQ